MSLFRTSAPAILIPVTNAIEALNAKLRRAVKIRGHLPNDEAATKLIYLVLRQTAAEWNMSPRLFEEGIERWVSYSPPASPA